MAPEMVHCVTGKGRADRCPDADCGSDDPERKVEPAATPHDVGDNQRHKDPEHGSRYAVEGLDGDHDARIPYDRKQRAARRQCRKAED